MHVGKWTTLSAQEYVFVIPGQTCHEANQNHFQWLKRFADKQMIALLITVRLLYPLQRRETLLKKVSYV